MAFVQICLDLSSSLSLQSRHSYSASSRNVRVFSSAGPEVRTPLDPMRENAWRKKKRAQRQRERCGRFLTIDLVHGRLSADRTAAYQNCRRKRREAPTPKNLYEENAEDNDKSHRLRKASMPDFPPTRRDCSLSRREALADV